MERMGINCLLKQMKAALEQYERLHTRKLGLTSSQCIMLVFLFAKGSGTVYATDIHQAIGISKPTVSTVLKSLKNKGYLSMVGDGMDDRRKKIVLEQKAYEEKEEIEAFLRKRGEDMCKGISPQEMEIAETVLNRMIFNLKQNTNHEEELI